MIYFDSTYFGRLYLDEHGSAEVRQLAAEHREVASCVIGLAEVASVFHRKLREAECGVAGASSGEAKSHRFFIASFARARSVPTSTVNS